MPSLPPPSEQVSIIQADKDQARAFWDAWDLTAKQASELTSAFARHRQAHSAPVVDGAREALEYIAKDMENAVAGGMSWISHSECYDFTRRIRTQIAALSAPASAGVRDHPVFAFLMGEGELDGVWFGDPLTGRRPYWWRRHLKAALSASPPPEQGAEAGRAAIEECARVADRREQRLKELSRRHVERGLVRSAAELDLRSDIAANIARAIRSLAGDQK